MPAREKIYIHVTESIILNSNEKFSRKNVIQGGAMYGRVLFTETAMLVVKGENNVIEHCVFERLN